MIQTQSSYHKTASQIDQERSEIEAAKNNPKAFGALYKRYHKPVLLFVYQRVADKSSAVDITQDVFVKAMQNLPRYEFRGLPFSAWLFRIAINEVNQKFRKDKRAINVTTDNLRDMAAEMGEEEDPEKLNLLANALQKLKPETLELVEMRFFEQRPFKEIAAIKNIGESGVKMSVYRALDRLKELLKNYDHE